MQDKIFKVKIFEVTRKSVKSMKVFSLEIFRLYGTIYMVYLVNSLANWNVNANWWTFSLANRRILM